MKINKLTFALILSCLFFGCRVKKATNNYYTHQTECVSAELDGKQIVTAWSNGSETQKALEQAKKNAVNDVLFGGITNGKSNCNFKPILANVNAKSANEAYFNKFFMDGGDYRYFAVIKDADVEKAFYKSLKKKNLITQNMIDKGFVFEIKTPQLLQKMVSDGILKQ